MFDHVQIKVINYTKSRALYEKILSVLGHTVVLESETTVGIGTSTHDMFEISEESKERPLSQCVHIAFTARSKKAVDDFYETALSLGATDNGAPGFRPEYVEGYYAAFVLDYDGNNVEVVYDALTSK